MTHWPFEPLRPLGYGAIIADPPWAYEMYSTKGYKKSPEAHYVTLPDESILNLPVGQLAGKDCLLFLWATYPKLPLAIACLKAWGFAYVTGGVWMKRTASGKLRWGPGYCLRSVCEPFLIGRMGSPQARITDQPNAFGDLTLSDEEMGGGIIINALAREHSRKPPQARALVERLTPQAFRCELFAREPWVDASGHKNDIWGLEVNKFWDDCKS